MLAARAESGIDVVALIARMTEAVTEAESLRRGAEGDAEVMRCVEERLVSMRALLELAGRAQAQSMSADSEGKADLEARKVMVAASRQEALLAAARQCISPEAVVVLDCPECPVEPGITEAVPEEPVEDGQGMGTVSPFE